MTEATLYPSWRDVVAFSDDGPAQRVLIETDTLKSVIVGLYAGQQIPVHPTGAATYHVLEGTGWIIVGDERYRVEPGATVTAPDGAARGVEAETRMVFLGNKAG